MASAFRFLSPSSSIADRSLDSNPKYQSIERSTTKSTPDLEDGEISEDSKLPAQPLFEKSPAQPPVIAENLSPSKSNESTRSPDAINEDASTEPQVLSQTSENCALEYPSVAWPKHALHCALSEEELDRAKSLVLDLLGWGVEPEYLVECGVSSHAIYRIFTDLHLRLPSNLVYPC